MNEFLGIFSGIFILIAMHTIAIAGIYILGIILFSGTADYSVLFFWIYAAFGFGLIQLLYVIPLVLKLKRERRWAMMKGVIIGAVITALVNFVCLLIFGRSLF